MRKALWLALILTAAPALAGTKRLAIVFGHNGGQGPRPALRYAEADAARVAKLFAEAGNVAPAHLKLLQGRPVAELFAALDWAKAQAKTDPQTLLFLYVSTHATAEDGLLPGAEPRPGDAEQDLEQAEQSDLRGRQLARQTDHQQAGDGQLHDAEDGQ